MQPAVPDSAGKQEAGLVARTSFPRCEIPTGLKAVRAVLFNSRISVSFHAAPRSLGRNRPRRAGRLGGR